MKKIICLLLSFLSCFFLFASCAGNLKLQWTSDVKIGVVCWGDSLTVGAGGGGTNYPSVLYENIKSEYGNIAEVINFGVGGESSDMVCARAGVYNPLALTKEVTLPQSCEKVEIFLNYYVLRQGGEDSVNPCSIGGVEGEITIEQKSYTATEVHYYFTRSNEGEAVTVSAGETVVTAATNRYKDYISVIFIGQNGGWAEAEDLIAQQRALIERQEKNKDKFLILGLTSGSKESRAELEEKMQAEYGEKYVNLREYLSGDGVKDAGVKASEEDEALMAEGSVPACLRADNVHLNAKGYRAVGNYIYQRMKKLGYFNAFSA